jgi:KDO2-lipid IV(A) lauroyltransferase
MLRALAWVVALSPFSLLPRLSAVLAFLAFDVLRIRRKHVIASLERAGLDRAHARGVYRQLGTSALEFLWLSVHRAVPATELMRIDGADRYFAAHARGRGVIVATAHTGNWDLAACACAGRTELSVVTKRQSSPSVDAFWQQTRSGRGVDLIAAPDGNVLRAIRERLARRRAVALLVDQDPERTHSVVSAPFLGEVAVHDTLAATIAARTGAPIVVAFARRDGPQNVLEIVEVIDAPAHADRAWIHATTRRIAECLDAFVRMHPSSWLWLHRRWKTRPTGCDAATASPTMA